MMESVNDRIKTIFNEFDGTQEDFGRKIGVTKAAVGLWLHNRTVPNARHMLKIVRAFPNFNGEWILTGRGARYSDKTKDTEYESKIKQLTRVIALKEKLINSLKNQVKHLKK